MKIRPFGAMILVEREAAEQRTPGGLIIPDNARKKTCRGRVVAKGPGRWTEHGIFRSTDDITLGERIVWDRDGAHDVPWAEGMMLVSYEYVIARLEDA